MLSPSLTKEELNIDDALTQAIDSFANKKTGITSKFLKILHYYDEPKPFQYYAEIKGSKKSLEKYSGGKASGISFFSRKKAALCCLGEAVERFAMENLDTSRIVFKKPDQLNKPSMSISSIVSFSKNQRKNNPILKEKPDSSYGWVLGYSLPSTQPTYIPAQLIYYFGLKKETLLRTPISTGCASGTSLSSSIYRGMCEVIERDALMITYLNKLPRSRVDIENAKNSKLKTLVNIAHNYNLEPYLIDFSTDLEAYTFLAILIDRTGIGTALTAGCESSLNPIDAMVGALEESFMGHSWLRSEKENFKGMKPSSQMPTTILDRAQLWMGLENIPRLDFILKNKSPMRKIEEYKNKSTGNMVKDMNYLVKTITSKGYHVYFVDITPDIDAVRKTEFNVIKVSIPELQPMHLNELYPYFGGKRLYEVPVLLGYTSVPTKEKDLNDFPHFFL